MHLYNTAIRKIEKFKPLRAPAVTFYTCGPTVYDYTHIGHLRTYVNSDILKRVLSYNSYQIKQVMNITDVGHLTDDSDLGEDKLEKGAKKQNKTVWEVAKFFTDYFFYSTEKLNILKPDIICKATDHIPEMLKLINQLKQKGFIYETEQAVYFDTAKFKDYGRLNSQQQQEKLVGAREEVYIDPQKKQPADFVLWFKRVGRFSNHTMHWDSPWGDGFPGWHIECSAMSMKYLGETIDIHAGGIDHISIHHPNEIAQSEAATGKKFVKYWFHSEFLLVDGRKMSKSLNNFYTIDDLKNKSFEPLALRYLFLQSHYQSLSNFTWEAVSAAQEGYNNLKTAVLQLKKQKQRAVLSEEKLVKIDDYRNEFLSAVNNNLQIPQALAVMFEVLKSNIPSTDKYDLIKEFDQIFGLKLGEIEEEKIPAEIIKLAEEREKSRAIKDFKKADELRIQIESKGWGITDINDEYEIYKK